MSTQNDIRTLEEAQAATDWYVRVKVHNNSAWDATLYARILGSAGSIEEEPQDAPAYSTANGGKYDAPFGPYGAGGLVAYNSPDPNWRFAFQFEMPYIGGNSSTVRIVDKNTSIDIYLFRSMDGSGVTEASRDITIDGKVYTAKISTSIGGGTTPNDDCYIYISEK